MPHSTLWQYDCQQSKEMIKISRMATLHQRDREKESYCLNVILGSDEMGHWGVRCRWQTRQYFSAGSVAISQGAAVGQHSSWWTQRGGIPWAERRFEQESQKGAGSGVPHRWKLRPLAFSVPNPSSACIGNHPSRPFPNAPSPIISLSLFFFFYTVNHLIDSYSWAFYCIQLCGSKKMSPSWYVAAFHRDRPRTKAKKRSTSIWT